jgi:hypothetical protein
MKNTRKKLINYTKVGASGRKIKLKGPSRSAQPVSKPRFKLRTFCALITRPCNSIKQQISARVEKKKTGEGDTTLYSFVLT